MAMDGTNPSSFSSSAGFVLSLAVGGLGKTLMSMRGTAGSELSPTQSLHAAQVSDPLVANEDVAEKGCGALMAVLPESPLYVTAGVVRGRR